MMGVLKVGCFVIVFVMCDLGRFEAVVIEIDFDDR